MVPDFRTPAFSFVALSGIRFRLVAEGGRPGPFRSDYRCQLHYSGEADGRLDEVRVYFVGKEAANAGEDVAAVIAFLDWQGQRDRCRAGTAFELREGSVITATGIVQSVAVR